MVEPSHGTPIKTEGNIAYTSWMGNLEAVNRLRRERGQPILRDPSTPRRLSIKQKISQLTLEQRLAGIHTPFTYGKISKMDEIRVPEVQEMILDPNIRTEGLIDYFANRGHQPDIDAFAIEFDFYQLLRILEPEVFKRSGPHHMIDRNGAFFWRNYTLDLELYEHDQEYIERRHPGIHKKLGEIKPAILKLNELIVQGQDPSKFDWKHFNESPPEG